MTIEELRELERAATEGPWRYKRDGSLWHWVVRPGSYDMTASDAALIAAMRNALPALLDFVKAAGVADEIRYFVESSECLSSACRDLTAALAALDTP